MMVDLLVAFDYSPGDEVIKEGVEGDSMYIVAGGDTSECMLMCVFLSACASVSLHLNLRDLL